MRKLNLLGCPKVEDKGIELIASQFKFLQEVDLGGSGITSGGLRHLAS